MLILYIIIILIILYILLSFIFFTFVSNGKFRLAFKVIDKQIIKAIAPYSGLHSSGLNWVRAQKLKQINIKSNDGLKLHGVLLEHPKAKGILLLAHGYRSTKERDVYASARNYYEMGMSILFIDQRCCGASEGKYITFGIKESEDINLWVKYLSKKYHRKPIFLAGISLGATSVLLVNNKRVKAIVADSGFASGYDEVKYCLNHYFHLPGFLFMPMINFYAKHIGNFDLKKNNTLDNLNNLNIPILFIHGKLDDFVPYDNCLKNYDNYQGPKEILLIDDATHGMGFLVNSTKYLEVVKNFINKYL